MTSSHSACWLPVNSLAFRIGRRRNLELLFGFCSDFVHSGYVSVLAIGEPSSDVILGGAGDAFTPRAENFAELKQRLLAECAGAYADLLVPALRHAIGRTLATGLPSAWDEDLSAAVAIIGDIRTILHRRLVEFVRKGFIASGAAFGSTVSVVVMLILVFLITNGTGTVRTAARASCFMRWATRWIMSCRRSALATCSAVMRQRSQPSTLPRERS
jgi:hypothetical protein